MIKNFNQSIKMLFLMSTFFLLKSISINAQDSVAVDTANLDANAEENNKTKETLNEVIVTGVSNPKAALSSSISIFSFKNTDVNNTVSRTTAEALRYISGLRVESSGGDGNSNITVRGVPISAGGSRYMLMQEDGLPVLQFGDVAFGTQDQFLRFDNTIEKIEAVKGGSASILASNSPAGILNFISKTGEKQGGNISTNIGLDYKMFRTDFNYGSSLAKDLFFHIGGFYRTGDGPRQTGYTSNNGGQIKLNITKKFEKGFVRVYAKFLDDRTPAYMPMPFAVTGTDASPNWKAAPNYDVLKGALQSVYLQQNRTVNDGNILNTNVADGIHSVTKSLGMEFNFDLGNGFKISNNMRYSVNGGQFIAPFPASSGTYSDIFNTTDVPSFATAKYANSNELVDQNATFMRVHLFNTTLNNFNNFANNFILSKSFDKVKVDVGLYKANQNINMTWLWNTYFMEANTSKQMPLVDVYDATGNALTTKGLYAYGTPAWDKGNSARNYDVNYDIMAPFVNVEVKIIPTLTFDGGLRYDVGRVSGSTRGGDLQTNSIDVNLNGVIDPNEKNVYVITTKSTTPINYSYEYLSYSAGLNMVLDPKQSVFVRTSSGGTASADRVLFNAYNYVGNGDPSLNAQKVNFVTQTELGYKLRANQLQVNATLFAVFTKESNYDLTTQTKLDNKYRSLGIELDARYKINKLIDLRGSITYNNSVITDAKDSTIVGNMPQRVPALMYSFMPTINFYRNSYIGITVFGTTQTFTGNANKLIMPAYAVVNAIVNVEVVKNFRVNVGVNNIFNTIALTEASSAALATNKTTSYVNARPLIGRNISFGLSYSF